MSTFADDLLDLLSPLGNVSAKRMFGGHGIYKDGLMFGFIARGRFYLRTDDETKHHFIEKGCELFYFGESRGTPIPSKYYEPPESAFLNAQKMKPWALLAWETTQRIPPGKKKAAKKKRSD